MTPNIILCLLRKVFGPVSRPLLTNEAVGVPAGCGRGFLFGCKHCSPWILGFWLGPLGDDFDFGPCVSSPCCAPAFRMHPPFPCLPSVPGRLPPAQPVQDALDCLECHLEDHPTGHRPSPPPPAPNTHPTQAHTQTPPNPTPRHPY